MESEMISSTCRAVLRAVEKFEEEKSISYLDGLLFHTNILYRYLVVYCDDDHILEEVGKSMAILEDIQENTEQSGYVVNPVQCQTSRGRLKFDIKKEQIEHLLQLHFTCPRLHLCWVCLSVLLGGE